MEARKLCEVTEKALHEAIKLCKPGAPYNQIGKVRDPGRSSWLAAAHDASRCPVSSEHAPVRALMRSSCSFRPCSLTNGGLPASN